jgi:ATP-dependent DNA helicase PIF1
MTTKFIDIITAFRRGNVFLHGPGGTGKSYTIGKIMEVLQHDKIYCTASTGIAAVNLNTDFFKATTLHKWTGLQLCQRPVNECVEIIMDKFPLKRKWQNTRYLIIDEVSMISGLFFQKLDSIAKIVRNNNLPFGGIHVLVSGDFLQLPPVEGGWIFLSDAWKEMDFKIFNFKEPKRYPDREWFEFLIRCREGKLKREDLFMLEDRVNAYKRYCGTLKIPEIELEDVRALLDEGLKCAICLDDSDAKPYAKTGCGCYTAKSSMAHCECLVAWILTRAHNCKAVCPLCKTNFSEEFNKCFNYTGVDENGEYKVKPTILYSTRAEVEELNASELEKLPTERVEIVAIDAYYDIKSNASKAEPQPVFNDVIPPKIVLCVGSQVMLKWNVETDAGLANGTRGVIVEINKFESSPSEGTGFGVTSETSPSNYQIKVKWYNGLITIVEPQTWKIEDDYCIRSRMQIPLVLAWALTIHKSQGSTLDYVICDLGSSVFAPGQAYVALSRVKTIEGLLISEIDYACLFKQDKRALEFVRNNS